MYLGTPGATIDTPLTFPGGESVIRRPEGRRESGLGNWTSSLLGALLACVPSQSVLAAWGSYRMPQGLARDRPGEGASRCTDLDLDLDRELNQGWAATP